MLKFVLQIRQKNLGGNTLKMKIGQMSMSEQNTAHFGVLNLINGASRLPIMKVQGIHGFIMAAVEFWEATRV
jgi:hypothetical protein